MNYVIYFLIAISATTLGSLTGMGGGVIIKPLLDMLGQFDAANIGVLSSVTVFSMSVVSAGKQLFKRTTLDYKIAITLAVGSIVGGLVGQEALSFAIDLFVRNHYVILLQNIILSALIISVYLYMRYKDKLPSYSIKSLTATLFVGIILGAISSFVGIGGGPINVALIIFVFSYDMKMAATCSIITILFAQVSKLFTISMGTGFAVYDLTMLPVMVVGAVMGGFIGSFFTSKFTIKQVEFYFNAVQLFVLLTCAINIFRNI